VLRANGVASAALVDHSGFGRPGEIYSRALIVRQPLGPFFRPLDTKQFDRLRAHTAWASHKLADAFTLRELQENEPRWREDSLPWLDKVRSHLGGQDKTELFVERVNPVWRYYKANSTMTLLELPPAGALALRNAFSFYVPQSVQQGTRLIISASGIHNAVSLSAIRKAKRLMQVIDRSHYTRLDTREKSSLLVVPLESHCILMGGTAVVILRENCGYDTFRKAYNTWAGPGRRAAAIFGQSGSFTWSDHIDSARFERLAEDLLTVESGVVRVRSAGPHTERDQGRDLIADWVQIVDAATDPPKLPTKRILVQVKSRGRTIGKSDVRDVRDTIERHSADGFLLIGYPKFSGDLINYLETLRQRGHCIDWWSREQLEERLRSNLNIVARYPEIVRYYPPSVAKKEG
jgi:hypothetical protein